MIANSDFYSLALAHFGERIIANPLTEGCKQLVRETSRWRQMTRAIGLVMGEEGGAQ